MAKQKIKCIEVGVYKSELTLNKEYDVLRLYEEEDDDVAVIINDLGEEEGYTMMHFTTV